MRNLLLVARREYIETIRTKAFLLSVFVAPIAMALLVFLVVRTHGGPTAQADHHLAIADRTGQLADPLRARFEAHNLAHPDQRLIVDDLLSRDAPDDDFAQRMKAAVRQGQLYAYVQIEPQSLDGPGRPRPPAAEARIFLRNVNFSTLDATAAIESVISQAAFQARCRKVGLDPDDVSRLSRRLAAEQVIVGREDGREAAAGVERQISAMLVPFFFMFLMFMGITGMAQFLLSSVMEEKASRIIEVLLSAMSPLELLGGKILGMAALGFTAIAVWGTMAYLAAQRADIDIKIPAALVPLLLTYYVLGFLLVTSILAGLGSVCNSHKEAQSMMMPVMLLLTLPLMLWFVVARDPDGTLARALSFVPPLTPTIMALRLSTSPTISPWEVAASIALLAVSVVVALWAGARIFRTGILMYGKRQSLREIARWLWQR